jgi:hypothetical protein
MNCRKLCGLWSNNSFCFEIWCKSNESTVYGLFDWLNPTSYITNFMGHDLAIIVMRNYFFISLYGININVINLLVLFEHWCHMHCLNTNVICMFVLFRHRCCMSICVVHTWKSCAQVPCLNNAWHSCLNYTNPWNNRFHTNLEWTHEAYKFVM